jgi:MFS family permease
MPSDPAKTGTLDFVRTLVTPICSYSLANVVFSLVPVMVSVLMDRQALTGSQAGLVAGLDMLAIVLPGFLLGSVLPGIEKRTLLVVGSLAVVAGNLLSVMFGGIAELLVIRAVSGLGAGLLFACANAMLASASDPVRAYAYASMGATLSGSVLLLGLPVLVTRWGATGYYVPVALLAAAFVALAARGPREPFQVTSASIGSGTWSAGRLRLGLLALGVILLTIPMEAYWAFAERIGLRIGADAELMGAVFAASYVCGMATAALASWLSTRWGMVRMMVIGFGMQALAIMIACTVIDKNVVLGAIIVQVLAVSFGVPYLFGLGAEADDSGRFVNVVVGLFYLTLAAGTFLGGILADSAGFGAIAWITPFCTLAGLVAIVPASMAVRVHRRTIASP